MGDYNQPQNQRAGAGLCPPGLSTSRWTARLGGISMGRKRLVVLAVVGSVFSAAGLLLAHHSTAHFDTRVITLKGTVTEFKLVNPHPLLYFTVTDEAGNVAEWFGESGIAPFRWYNRGWKGNSLEPGDAITVEGNPSKDSSQKVLRMRRIIVDADDREWTEGGVEPTRPPVR
jgi:hypothetical protein